MILLIDIKRRSTGNLKQVAKQQTKPIAETDLYRPLYKYLSKEGYTVRSEVMNCDITAVKDDNLIIIELKKTLNIALLVQAVERQKITESVYVAIPRPPDKRKWMIQSKPVQVLLKRLEIGLILVATMPGRPPVDIILHPSTYERRKRRVVKRAILDEISRRSGDFNEGGSCRTKLVTAYRENAIHIACCLAELGPLTPRALRGLGTGEKTQSILSKNVYSWFDKVSLGLYALSSTGRDALSNYPELVELYSRRNTVNEDS